MATRIKMAPEARRTQLLDCAQALFFSKGYEATTVNDVIDRTGLSKGAFYHYFDSKEALLDALIERVSAQIIEDSAAVLEDPALDALSRLNAFLEQGRDWKFERAPLMRAFTSVLQAGNEVLNQRLLLTSARLVIPVVADIVRQGVQEGVFDTPAPEMVAEIVMQLGSARLAVAVEAFALASRGDLSAATALLEDRLAKEEAVIERLLGVAPGAIRLVEPGFVRNMLAALT